MDFTNRSAQPQPVQQTTRNQDDAAPQSGTERRSKDKKHRWSTGHLLRLASVVLLFSITILMVAIASLLYFGNNNESQYVLSSKFQAVDLSVNGTSGSDQVYFGHITRLTSQYIVLQDIYYTVPNQTSGTSGTPQSQTQPASYQLVKLGCELVGQYDQMIINRDQVILWENLRSNGTVAEKIAQDQKQNPNGPNCSAQSSSNTSSTSSTTTTTPAATSTTPATTTPATTTKP